MGEKLKRLYMNYIFVNESQLVKWKVYLAKNNMTALQLFTQIITEFIDGLDD